MVDFIALIAALAVVGGLIFTGWSFWRLGKTEELKLVEGVDRNLAHSLKEYNLLNYESPKSTEEEAIRLTKVEYLLIEFFVDLNWLCYLIRHEQIKDNELINYFKRQIITWHKLFVENMDEERVRNNTSFPDFKILYRRLICEQYKEIAWNEKHPHLAKLKKWIRSIKLKRRRYYYMH